MKLLIVLFLVISLVGYSQPSGYAYGKQLLVQASQVSGSSNLIDFPMLVSFIDPDLRTTANGGKVQNTNGYDILFTIGDCSSVLEHQIEKYDPITGEYIAWVLLPSLSASVNTNLHIYYGNSSIATDPSTTNVWSSDYAAVWHLNQSPALTAPQIIDYTANSNNGSSSGAMTATDLVTGKIGFGIDFDGTNDFIDCGDDPSLDPQQDLTVSAWIFSKGSRGHIINRGGGWNDPGYSLFYLNNQIRIELQRAGEKDIIDNAISANAWHYTVLTYSNTTGLVKCYIDGVQQTNTATHTGPIGMPTENLNIARKEQNGVFFDGVIDEGRISLAEKSADWIATEYSNQNTPASFYTISAEMSATDLCANFLPIELINFDIAKNTNNQVIINWQTASEVNNDFFTLERSYDAVNWNTISKLKGAGNSSQLLNYSTLDPYPLKGKSYYRLKQTDFDKKFEYSLVKSISIDFESELSVFPNPFDNILTVELTSIELEGIEVYNMLGQNVTTMTKITVIAPHKSRIDFSDLISGIYLIQSNNSFTKVLKR